MSVLAKRIQESLLQYGYECHVDVAYIDNFEMIGWCFMITGNKRTVYVKRHVHEMVSTTINKICDSIVEQVRQELAI